MAGFSRLRRPAMPSSSAPTPDQIRELIDGQLIEFSPGFGNEDDLFEAGLDSMAIMQLLLLMRKISEWKFPWAR